ncbi:hypothetical protein [Amycolatopsis taiwanensis]|uniref:Uncharacterized protein n=1 Tax=Amycolatopsis taiwanensis TaxID=342230 RepID=A0A9W6VEU8_9PSEU|nr:hypothetical protein [Amycolatopsis taiwanensis]GLY63861.1 hypothetical protein Atai01_04800 [Amycolatopsis taiwanensis]
MTTSEMDPPAMDPEDAAAGNEEAQASPAGNWSPNTPPATATPDGNWSPNTPPATVTPDGNWSPNTPPKTATPDGNWSPNTPPATVTPDGNWSPNTPPKTATPDGNWSPNTPPATVTPNGNWSPNTPPSTVVTVSRPNTASAGSDGSALVQPNGNGVARDVSPARTGVITQLWSSSTAPGVWALVSGIGWKRLAGAEAGHGALITLALLARANGLPVSFHEDAHGQIDQLLV